MKYVSVITDYTYLLWQQEIQIFNFKKLGILNDLCVVVLIEPGKKPSEYVKKIASLCETRIYENDQKDRSYVPSNKPYGLMKLLEEFPHYGEKVFLLDSDVVFFDKLDFTIMDSDDRWYFSNAISYIGYKYLSRCLSQEDILELIGVIGNDLTIEKLMAEESNSGGAQMYMKNVTPEFCKKVTEDSIELYRILKKKKEAGSKVQIWTAEMWSWLWNAFLIVDVKVIRELDFAWATEKISPNPYKKILHMAGVVNKEEHKGLFRKGKYPHAVPWRDDNLEKDLTDDNYSWVYVQLLKEYRDQLN